MRSNFHEGTAARGRGGPGSAALPEADTIVSRGPPGYLFFVPRRGKSREAEGRTVAAAAAAEDKGQPAYTPGPLAGDRLLLLLALLLIVAGRLRAEGPVLRPRFFHVNAVVTWLPPFWASASVC